MAVCAFLFVYEKQIEEKISGEIVSAADKADFKMYVVDVGQGDSIYIEFSDNKNMLIDCGKGKEVDKLGSFLNDKKVEKIDYLVYTHADEDHIGGGDYVFENYQINVLYRPKMLSSEESSTYGNPLDYNVHDTKAYNNAIISAYEEPNCEIRYSFKGESIVGADYVVKFLSPCQDSYDDPNNYSAVMMIEVNNKKVLLTGDAEKNVEDALILEYNDYLDADVLKVGHHGSNTSSSRNFLEAVSPDYALISVGENSYGHPHEEVLTRLNNANVKNIYNTKEAGTIVTGISDGGDINTYGYKQKFNLDMPIIAGVAFGLILLTWGLSLVKKNKKTKSKKNTKN